MNEMYNRIEALCKERGINITEMCRRADVPRGALTDLKMNRTIELSTKTLAKISMFFHVSMDYLLGNVSEPYFHLDNERIKADINSYEDGSEQEKAPTPEGERLISDAELKAAFFGGYADDLPKEEIDALWEDAREYAMFKASQKKRSEKK